MTERLSPEERWRLRNKRAIEDAEAEADKADPVEWALNHADRLIEGIVDPWELAYARRMRERLDAARATVPDAGLREALAKFVTGEGAMATDPDGDCYFCEAEGVDFELPFHPGADPDYAGEHADWCLVPIARQWLAALPAPDPRP